MVHRETQGIGFQFCEGPLSPDALKLPLFDWEAERERESKGEEEEEVESERVLVWSK